MTSKKIRIEGVADFSKIAKETQKLTREIEKSFGKEGVQIFDQETMTFISRSSTQNLGKMQEALRKLVKEAESLSDELKASADSEEKSAELSRKKLENLRQQAQLHRQIRTVSSVTQVANLGGSENIKNVTPMKSGALRTLGKEATQGVAQVGSAIPSNGVIGVGARAVGAFGRGVAVGGGVGASAMLLGASFAALSVAVGGAILAIQRMQAGFEVFKASLPDRLFLQAIGTDVVKGTGRNTAIQTGFDVQQTLSTQKSLAQALGSTTQQGEENRLANILLASRDLGVEPEMLSGMGQQLRTQGGTDFASKQLGLILDRAITSGMDKSQATAFLQSATGLLTQLNETGTRDTDKLVSVMTDLINKRGMSPEQAAKRIAGISSAIAGSSGEDNAFFQTAAAQGGLGGKTLLGSMLAVRQGLSGINRGALEEQLGDTAFGRNAISALDATGLTDPEFTQKFAQGILRGLDMQGYDQKTPEGLLGRAGFVMDRFGASNIEEALQIESILRKVAEKGEGSLGKDERKLFKDLNASPEERWRSDVLKKLDLLATAQTLAAKSFSQLELGEKSAPLFNSLTNALTKLDQTLSKVIDFVGFLPDRIKKALDDFKTKPGEFLANMTGGAIDIVSEIGKTLTTLPSLILDSFLEGAKTLANYLADAFKNLLGLGEDSSFAKIQSGLNSAVEYVQDANFSSAAGLANGWDSITNKAKSFLGVGSQPAVNDTEWDAGAFMSGLPEKQTSSNNPDASSKDQKKELSQEQVVNLLQENVRVLKKQLQVMETPRVGTANRGSSRKGE